MSNKLATEFLTNEAVKQFANFKGKGRQRIIGPLILHPGFPVGAIEAGAAMVEALRENYPGFTFIDRSDDYYVRIEAQQVKA